MKNDSSIWFDIVNYTLQILFTLLCVYPFYYILIYSISDPQQALKGVFLLPNGFTIVNYTHIFRLDNMLNSFFISVLRTVSGTILTIACSSWLAYAVTKNELYFRKTIYRFVVITMYFNAGLIPWYITMKELGLKNNFLLYILPVAVVAYYVVLFKTFIEQLPPALEESAMIDGAGFLKIFTHVIFPLSMPIIATIAVFASVGQWNTWYDNYFLVSDDRLQTLQLILYNYLTDAQRIVSSSNLQDLNRGLAAKISPDSIRITITMVVTIPVLLVYPFLQRFFVKGLMVGAIKG
ncbi:putative aldouronate transport system permease protein [Paenibacillus taihuensis]|uniref:Putative aldouronate transport system permease protein n=1 Tax=Paenibacillus taihuensis TaxID=1156355 RepID=A0A3D9SFA1_9BACL|nr:carbohydrate ABC transporter permease [Paenibacillus taihuensis]REE94582.1 putative aldouronate transport system permease protein [Paenibacillus taihuensis]